MLSQTILFIILILALIGGLPNPGAISRCWGHDPFRRHRPDPADRHYSRADGLDPVLSRLIAAKQQPPGAPISAKAVCSAGPLPRSL